MATVKKVQNNGDTTTWRFRVYNGSDITCSGVQVQLTIPAGVRLTGPLVSGTSTLDVPVGSFNPTSEVWFIGTMASKTYTDYINWEFTVDDVSLVTDADDYFEITATTSSRCVDSDSTNNDLEFRIQVGEDCNEINLSVGGTLPSSGTSGLEICV